MRQIEFRGKTINNDIWVYGFYMYSERLDKHFIIGESKDYGFHREQVIPETVGESTGLFDKNGKKIFEGDIVFNSNRTYLTLPEDKRLYLVEWMDGKYEGNWLKVKPGFKFNKIVTDGKNYISLIFNQSQIEVVANIHDNPELI